MRKKYTAIIKDSLQSLSGGFISFNFILFVSGNVNKLRGFCTPCLILIAGATGCVRYAKYSYDFPV